MTIYIDITQLDRGRENTGIQRVVKEVLKRIGDTQDINYKILSYNSDISSMEVIQNSDIFPFLQDIKNFQFIDKKPIDITNIVPEDLTLFFDIDSAWNAPMKRANLYPALKANGFLIFNFIYDLVPILFPQYSHVNTVENFKPYINLVCMHSDMVFFDSMSAQNDFLDYKKTTNYTRPIPTRTIALGSDFLKKPIEVEEKNIKEILQKKYILFVGTIEPRKNQEDVLNAFEVLSEKYLDLNLVFIGKSGWKTDKLMHRIETHKLKDSRLFWLDNIDDNILSHFYQNAFIVTYLSKYEGYGLPIAESLQYSNITITSKNSSMYEVGKNYADYITYNSQNELEDTISLYYENSLLYESKKEYIKENYKPISWNTMTNSLVEIFNNFEKSITIRKKHQKLFQFVFISIDIKNLKGTVEAIDRFVNFAKEYIVITSPKLIEDFKQIKTDKKLTIIDETTILKKYAKDFHKKDHQSKNWLLRASLLNIDTLDDEFIMLDDDNRPLKDITIDKFISKDGSYNAYYFYNLLDWHHRDTDYDVGQQNMKEVLSKENYEMLSYSSHAPQIINKMLFKEAVDKFFDRGLNTPIDEWSIYFNYAVSTYPYAFNKKVFETLNWPDLPVYWEHIYLPQNISFENYYEEVYKNKTFTPSNTYAEKLQIKQNQVTPFLKSQEMFKENIKIIRSKNMAHGVCSFKANDIEFYLLDIPYYVILVENSAVRLKSNFKILNPTLKEVDIEIVLLLNGNFRNVKKITRLKNVKFQEDIIEIPISALKLEEGIYDITFDVKINSLYIFKQKSPYLMKLVVYEDETFLKYLEDIKTTKSLTFDKELVKSKIKSIPFFGWFGRFIYNILRINNLKHTAFINQNRIASLEHQNVMQQKQLISLQKQLILKQKEIDSIRDTIDSKIAKEMHFQSLSVQHRMDQFIFDSKITKKNEK